MNGRDIALRLVDAVIVVAMLESVFLILLRTLGGRGPALSGVVPNLAAGLCLLGALRGELAGAAWPACASWLAAAGVAHAVDVCGRWPVQAGAARGRRRARPASETSHLGTERQS